MLRASRTLLVPATLLLALETRAATWTVPGLANAPGRNGTFFASELKLRNPGTAATAVTTFSLNVVLTP